MNKKVMDAIDVLEIVATLEQANIDVCLDRGWAIDALAGNRNLKVWLCVPKFPWANQYR